MIARMKGRASRRNGGWRKDCDGFHGFGGRKKWLGDLFFFFFFPFFFFFFASLLAVFSNSTFTLFGLQLFPPALRQIWASQRESDRTRGIFRRRPASCRGLKEGRSRDIPTGNPLILRLSAYPAAASFLSRRIALTTVCRSSQSSDSPSLLLLLAFPDPPGPRIKTPVLKDLQLVPVGSICRILFR